MKNCGLDNFYFSFKGREIDPAKRVKIYRNLNGGKLKRYSILQSGLVVGHTNQFLLVECKCLVNHYLQRKVRTEKRKRVHAFIFGKVAMKGAFGTTAASKNPLPATITYDPYKDYGFVCKNITSNPFPVFGAQAVMFKDNGVSAAYTF